MKEVKEQQNYPDHVPLNTAQNALLAVGSGVMGVLDTTRGGKLLLFMV
jgi:ubiquinone biosynthesis protein COQ4